MNGLDALLECEQAVAIEHGIDIGPGVHEVATRLEDFTLSCYVGVADGESHEETVQLALGERIGTVVLVWVLGGNDEERARQRQRFAVDAHGTLLHGLEQPTLSARRSSVDLVGQQNVGEDRSGPNLELRLSRVVHGAAQHVGGQQIGRELNTAELQAQ